MRFSVMSHKNKLRPLNLNVCVDVALSTNTAFTSGKKSDHFLSPVELACVGLSAALLIAFIANVAICCSHRRRYGGSALPGGHYKSLHSPHCVYFHVLG